MNSRSPAQLSRVPRAPLAEMERWFKDALGDWGPLPSTSECDGLARRFQLLVDKADNSEKLRIARQHGVLLSPVDGGLRNANVDDYLGDRLENVRQAGKELLFRLAELETFAGNYNWEGPSENISIEDLRHILLQIGVLVGADPEAKGQAASRSTAKSLASSSA